MAFPIHARYAHPDAGYIGDRERATAALHLGHVYTVDRMEVGASTSYLYLAGIPDVPFNSVMFEADPGPMPADVAAALAPEIAGIEDMRAAAEATRDEARRWAAGMPGHPGRMARALTEVMALALDWTTGHPPGQHPPPLDAHKAALAVEAAVRKGLES